MLCDPRNPNWGSMFKEESLGSRRQFGFHCSSLIVRQYVRWEKFQRRTYFPCCELVQGQSLYRSCSVPWMSARLKPLDYTGLKWSPRRRELTRQSPGEDTGVAVVVV